MKHIKPLILRKRKLKREVNKMPYGKGTYGSTRGRPPVKKKKKKKKK